MVGWWVGGFGNRCGELFLFQHTKESRTVFFLVKRGCSGFC